MLLRTVTSMLLLTGTAQARFLPPFQLTAPGGANGDEFGYDIAMSGDTLIVGVRSDDVGANTDQGSARVFRRTGSVWILEATLTAPDGDSGDWFGYSVDIEGDTVLIGTAFDDVGTNSNQGSAYVFVRSDSTWTHQATLTAPDGTADDSFGNSVAIAGDAVVIGTPLDDVGTTINQGTVHIFRRSGTIWNHEATLLAPDGAESDWFGEYVAIADNTVVAGSRLDDIGANTDQGSAHVFVYAESTWTHQAQLTAPDGTVNDGFGYSVAIGGETIVVGADFDDVGMNSDQGSAGVFVRSDTSWSHQATLTAPEGAAGDRFGYSLAIEGATIVVGAPLDNVDDNAEEGSSRVFVRSGTNWTQQATLTAPDGMPDDLFGYCVAINGGEVVVGSPFDSVAMNVAQGSVWVYSSCPGDANGDNLIDAADLSVLLSNFGQNNGGAAIGDFNNDGTVNGADLSVLLASFGTTCSTERQSRTLSDQPARQH